MLKLTTNAGKPDSLNFTLLHDGIAVEHWDDCTSVNDFIADCLDFAIHYDEELMISIPASKAISELVKSNSQ